MIDTNPEKKLLDLIKHAQGVLRLKKELRIFTKINVLLIGLIMVILAVFLFNFFTFRREDPELEVYLPKNKMEVLRVQPDFVSDIEAEFSQFFKNDEPLSVKEAPKNLTVLGIITGEDNQAVIEDKDAGKTFFLYKGDSIGDYKVFEIKDNAVILDYNGEKIELKM